MCAFWTHYISAYKNHIEINKPLFAYVKKGHYVLTLLFAYIGKSQKLVNRKNGIATQWEAAIFFRLPLKWFAIQFFPFILESYKMLGKTILVEINCALKVSWAKVIESVILISLFQNWNVVEQKAVHLFPYFRCFVFK